MLALSILVGLCLQAKANEAIELNNFGIEGVVVVAGSYEFPTEAPRENSQMGHFLTLKKLENKVSRLCPQDQEAKIVETSSNRSKKLVNKGSADIEYIEVNVQMTAICK